MEKKTTIIQQRKELEERKVIRPLTSTDVFIEAENPEPVFMNEMIVRLPVAFLREIQEVIRDNNIVRTLREYLITTQSKDEQIRKMPIVEQITVFTKILKDLISDTTGDPKKIDEFSKWAQGVHVLTYDFDKNLLIPAIS